MLKVGVPDSVSPELLKKFPKEVSLVRLPSDPKQDYEIDFWVLPLFEKPAKAIWPHLKGVRVAQSCLAGIDWIRRLIPEDITLCDGQGIHTISTAEWAVTATLAALKYLPFYFELQHEQSWSRRKDGEEHYRSLHPDTAPAFPPVMFEEVHGKKVLIVGYGSIGQAIEERLLPFGVEIVRVARSAREGVASVNQLSELLPQADVVILIVPLTKETEGLMGAKELALMKQGALLVNAARGPVLDTDALLAALQSRRIQAALDVTDPEPLPDGHPLWSAPNVMITPHVASSTPMFMVRAMELAAAQVGRYLRGEPLINIVTGDY
ncbi:2-hydroxyacid dehydrogenase [Paracidobacterium acidisoli]|uniref:Hydroxyacid dehydrogenase n=1 Tax=Paracidobacterium acidisoli TaxID=2303751 RepID=A0A372IMU7_9BACT|nr:2-hydroxyacid dehydrogenase [Paracidobacterium acidisoli]MBT9331939.1 2-hydroxyacid dehydrogenase [Paracidobacterium acidisoli]